MADKLNIEYIELDELKPYKRNNKKHADFDIGEIAKSIEKYGMNDPIGIWKDNQIIEGHGRIEACKKLGIDKVPCIRLDHLTDKERREYAILHNKTAELAEYDFDNLAAELPDLDFSDFNFDFGFDVDTDEQAEIAEDEIPEVDEQNEPTVKLGDIWQLGRHRLMCGDSTDKATVEKLMNGNKADMVFTDPPYGINIVKTSGKIGGDKPFGSTHGKHTKPPMGKVHGAKGRNAILESKEYMPIKGDETTDTAKLNYKICKSVSDNQIIFGANYFTDFLPPSRCWIVWDKENSGSFADVELAYTSFDKTAKLYKWLWNGLCRKGERAVEGKTRVHPTQKPVGLIAEILQDFSEENQIVLDCFGGSGSTLIACEQINRVCLMIEYEPYYCDVIIKRWETLTGEKAVKIN